MNHPNEQIARLHHRHVQHDLPAGDGIGQELLEPPLVPGRPPPGSPQRGRSPEQDVQRRVDRAPGSPERTACSSRSGRATGPRSRRAPRRRARGTRRGAAPPSRRARLAERHLAGEIGIQRGGLHLHPAGHLAQAECRHALFTHHGTSRRQDRAAHLLAVPLPAFCRDGNEGDSVAGASYPLHHAP